MKKRNHEALTEVDFVEDMFHLAKEVGDFARGLRPYVEEESCTKEEFDEKEAIKYKEFCIEDLSARYPAIVNQISNHGLGQECSHYLINALTTLYQWCKTLKNKNFVMEEYKEVFAMSRDFLRIQSNLLSYLYFYYELHDISEGIVSVMVEYCERCEIPVLEMIEVYENFFPHHPDQLTVEEQMIMGKFSHTFPNAFYFASNNDLEIQISDMETYLEEAEEPDVLEELKDELVNLFEGGELDFDDEEELEECLEDDDASMSCNILENLLWFRL